MDWFDQDENIFLENNNTNLNNSFDNEFNIDNMFLNKQNSLTDYEVKIEEFVLNTNNDNYGLKKENEIYSKIKKEELEGKDFNENNCNRNINNEKIINQNKIFNIIKEKKNSAKKSSKLLTKEELVRHPFLNSNFSTDNKSQKVEKELSIKASPSHSTDNNSKNKENCMSTASVEENSEFNINNSLKNYLYENNNNNSNSTINENINSDEEDLDSQDEENDSKYYEDKYEIDSLINNNSLGEFDRNLIMKRDLINYQNYSSNQKNNFNNFNYENKNSHQDNLCSNVYCVPLQNLSVSERMKIKKEKAKILLEKKTKRENYYFMEREEFNKNEQNNKISEGFHNIHNNINIKNNNFNNLQFNENYNLNNYNNFSNYTFDQFNSNQLSKKELKMLRNRISAQRSRDRKKKEMDELKIISQNLLNENRNLKRQLDIRDREIISIKDKLNLVCKNCKNLIKVDENNLNNNLNKNIINNDNIQMNRNYSLVDMSRRNFTSTLKYSLMTGFLVVVCLIGALVFSDNSSNINKNLISEKSSLKLRTLSDDATSVSTKTSSSAISKELMIYYPENNLSGIREMPFTISKDLDKLIKKKIQLSEENESNDINKEISYLNKKRLEFFSKMKNRKREKIEFGFLQNNLIKSNDMCVNADGMALSIQQEIELNDDQNFKEFSYDSDNDEVDNINNLNRNGIILKQNENYNSNYNGVVPVNKKDIMYNYEHSVLKENIKSMYCKDFITTAEENAKMFKNLFDKLNFNLEDEIKKEKKANDEDCMYLHMIVPTLDENQNDPHFNIFNQDGETISNEENLKFHKGNEQTHNFTNFDQASFNQKKVYYEVGCKIFEINKIYR